MSTINQEAAVFGEELKETMAGVQILIGTLPVTPYKIIMDNLSDVEVEISINDPSVVWKTFAASEALVLDQDDLPVVKGTRFYALGASGDFSVAYIYTKQG